MSDKQLKEILKTAGELLLLLYSAIKVTDWMIHWLEHWLLSISHSIIFCIFLYLFLSTSDIYYCFFVCILNYLHSNLPVHKYIYILAQIYFTLFVTSFLFPFSFSFSSCASTPIHYFILIRITHSYSFSFNYRCEECKENELGVFRRFLGRIVW